MPQMIAVALLPLLTSSPLFFLGPAAISAAATGLGYLATAAALYTVQALLTPKPEVPKAEDGSYNLKQAVPSPAFVLGRVKKGGDYLALEEKEGRAHHVIAMAAHRINRYVSHYLHDEEVTGMDGSGFVTAPDHFDQRVLIQSRVGLDVETAYPLAVTEIPAVWTNDHRGDGLATVYMRARSASSEDFQSVYPQGMPLHTAVVEGALLYDPRNGAHNPADHNTWTWSDNLALMRLWHLTDPVGSKLTLADMYMPEWIAAANVADELVTIGTFPEEKRYHGGFWFRAGDDQVMVGRIMDQAADMIVYERADGLVGVHPGAWAEPDVRLDADDIISCNFDANRRLSSTVLAVRGRFTNPLARWSEFDSDLIGNPYVPTEDSTERTKTVENTAVQSMSHMLRLQLLAFKRSNTPRVRITAHYEVAKNVPYRRFIRVHLPPRLDEALVEVLGRPQLSLAAMTYSFEGIVVPDGLYNFDVTPPTPPPPIPMMTSGDVPTVVNFQAILGYDVIGDGTVLGSFVRGTWDPPVDSSLLTEVEYQLTTGGAIQSIRSKTGETEVRTGVLTQGATYKFRARNWSSATPSDWTSYINVTIASATAPAALTSFGVTGGNGNAIFGVVATADPQLHHINVFVVPNGVTLDKNVHRKVVVPVTATSFNYTDGDASSATNNLLANSSFTAAAPPPTLGTGWTGTGTGVINHSATSGSSFSWTVAITPGVWRHYIDIDSMTAAGTLVPRNTGTVTEAWTTYTTAGFKLQSLNAVNSNTTFGFICSTNNVVQVDEVILFKQTAACAPQGWWDYYAFPSNAYGIEGTGATPVINVRVV